MPCYVIYKCFGYITDEELEKFLDIAKEKGYSYREQDDRSALMDHRVLL